MMSNVEKEKLAPDLRFPKYTEEWERNEIPKLGAIQRGRFSPRPRNNPIYYGGAIPFVQTSDVVNSGGLVETFTQTLNEKGLKVSKLFPRGTILITIAANIGYTGVLQIDMACPDSLVGIQCHPDVHNYFLNFVFQKEQPKMDYLAVEAAQKNINIAFLEIYVIITPTFPEQQKIANFLTALDARITQLVRKRALLEDFKKGVMQQLFTRAIRFKDDHGNDFPDWEEKKLGEVAELTSGQHLAPDQYDSDPKGVPYFTGPSDYTNDPSQFTKWTKSSSKIALTDSVLITVKGNGVGKLMYSTIPQVAMGRQLMAIRSESYNNALIFQILLTRTREFVALASGNLIPGLSRPDILVMSLSVPSELEQTKIANFLSAIDLKIERVATQITETQTFKRGLLQQMFV